MNRPESGTAMLGQRKTPQSGSLWMEITWWADDGTERRGWISVAPDASLETASVLARMMRLADAEAAALETSMESGPSKVAGRLDRLGTRRRGKHRRRL